ncbi:MAG: ABC transporter ATP-binding protein [Planctomycetota bacterium]
MSHDWEPEEDIYEKGIDPRLWRRLFGYTRPYRKQVILLIVQAILTAGVDIALPMVTRAVIDSVAEGAGVDALVRYSAIFLVLMVIQNLSVLAFIWLAGGIRTAVSHDIRRDGFANLQKLSFGYFDKRPVGWLMARMTSDCERLSNILAWGVLDLFWGLTTMGGIATVMIIIQPELALWVLTVIPLLVFVSYFFQKRILKTSRAVRKTNSQITAAYNEGIMGARTTKVFGRERQNLREFQQLSTEMHGNSVRNAVLSAMYLPSVVTIGSIATGLALALGGVKVVAGGITIGTLVMFMTYIRYFFDPIQEIAHWFAEMQMAQASAERIMGLIDEEPEIQDSPEVAKRIAQHSAGSDDAVAEDGYGARIDEIEFEDVSFRYGSGPPVLERFQLRVRAGESIALVGATGGGKSTIVGLLCRFYEPTAGRILIDGRDYRERGLHWLQSNLGMVLQTPHLFSGTVADNIRYGRLDATDDEIQAAAERVGAHEFIATMEGGYDTQVGEGGLMLSMGEKQLISFARAILARPQLLVMDEATSSIDTETEAKIQHGLEEVLAGRTSFIIAHRLSTVRSVDRILVIEGGRIVEQGSHDLLMERRGRYYQLYTQQSLRELKVKVG